MAHSNHTRLTQGERDEHSNTNETTPLHIWKHSAILLAKRHGASDRVIEEQNVRLVHAYQFGEAVWMAAEMLLVFSRENGLTRESTPSSAIAASISSAICAVAYGEKS